MGIVPKLTLPEPPSCTACGEIISPKINDSMCRECRDGLLSSKPRKLPPKPTKALPGSKEKIEVLRWRYANGYALWHPLDITFHITDKFELRGSYE